MPHSRRLPSTGDTQINVRRLTSGEHTELLRRPTARLRHEDERPRLPLIGLSSRGALGVPWSGAKAASGTALRGRGLTESLVLCSTVTLDLGWGVRGKGTLLRVGGRSWSPSWVAATVLALLAVATVQVGLSRPAASLTNNEKFIWAVHTDFFLRSPSADEVTWWTAYLGSGTRAGMLESILDSSEFKDFWVVGMSLRYLDEIDPGSFTMLDALEISDDFVATEVTLLAGATYFNSSGGTNTTYVQALYPDVLQRPVDATALSYWVGRLNAGTSTRSSVANYVIRSNESAQRRIGGSAGMTSCPTTELEDPMWLAAGSYCIVLDRVADSGGLSYWTTQLSGTDQLPSLWSSLARSTEYFNNALARF